MESCTRSANNTIRVVLECMNMTTRNQDRQSVCPNLSVRITTRDTHTTGYTNVSRSLRQTRASFTWKETATCATRLRTCLSKGTLSGATPKKPALDMFTGISSVLSEKTVRSTITKTNSETKVCLNGGAQQTQGSHSRTMMATSSASCSTSVTQKAGIFSRTATVVIV